MKSVAVIAEFNPFHLGHEAFLRHVREAFGEDACLTVIMSGNYVQRGDVAIFDKLTRAEAAVLGGADLILEFPFPYSMASADYFAEAGVSLACSIGADVLAFGSEEGDLPLLRDIAEKMMTEDFQAAVAEARQEKENRRLGYPALLEQVFFKLYGESARLLAHPNNLLAVRYLISLLSRENAPEPYTVKRTGSHHAAALSDGISGTAVRSALADGMAEKAFLALPPSSHRPFLLALEQGTAPATVSRLAPVLLASLRMSTGGSEAVRRLRKAATKTATLQEAVNASSVKHDTHSHARRELFYHYFGVTEELLKEPPAFSQILAMNETGRKLLSSLRKTNRFPLVTKPADAALLTGVAEAQALLSQKADTLYPLAMPKPLPGNYFMTVAPYCKK